MSSSPPNQQPVLAATYTSTHNAPFTISLPQQQQLPPQQKSQYLQDLRKAAASIQEQVNKELTQRMEEDKACESSTADAASVADSGGNNGGGVNNSKKRKKTVVIDDVAEEVNYGEEVVEDSD